MAGRWESLRTYIAECARILYWAYFRPYTFRRWLRDIDPDLDITTNPFRFCNRFPNNPRLYRYAEQRWWLIVMPYFLILMILLVFGLREGVSLWLEPFIFIGWWLVLCLIVFLCYHLSQIIREG